MKRTIVLLLIVALAAACNQGEKKKNETEQEKIITAAIEDLVTHPADFQDHEVAISGMVTHVCRHGGQKCFVLAGDGETQIRLVPGPGIDEFGIEMEGSSVAFRGTFRIAAADESLTEDQESGEPTETGAAHSQAEKANIYIEVSDFREITP